MGGDLRVESRKDVEKGVKVDVDAGLSHSNDPGSSITSKLSKVGTTHYADKVKEKLEAGVNKVVGGAVKNSITGPAGLQGQLKVNADVVNNNAVGEQSAITGKNGVALQVGSQTQLTGGEIRSQQGKVELGGSKVSQQDVSGHASTKQADAKAGVFSSK